MQQVTFMKILNFAFILLLTQHLLCKFRKTFLLRINVSMAELFSLLELNCAKHFGNNFLKKKLFLRKQIPDYPIGVYGSIGGLLFSESSEERIDPIICGGTTDNSQTTSACFVLHSKNDDRKWQPVANLTEPRSHASVTSYPVKNSSIPKGLLVAGGRSSRLSVC
jgi:hypothetical protein